MLNKDITNKYLLAVALFFLLIQVLIIFYDIIFYDYILLEIVGFLVAGLIHVLVPEYWKMRLFLQKGLSIEGTLFLIVFLFCIFFPLSGIIFLLIAILSYILTPTKWKTALLSKLPTEWLQRESLLAFFLAIFLFQILTEKVNIQYKLPKFFVFTSILMFFYVLEIVNRRYNNKN